MWAALTLAAGGGLAAFWLVRQARIRRFRAVVPGRIYRGGQPSALALWWLARIVGVRTIVNLREDAPCSEARFGLEEIRIPLPPGTNVPTVSQVAELLAVLDEPRYMPCLIHCKVGADRTGIMVAAFRILRQGWSYDRALAELERVKGKPTTELARERLLDVAAALRAEAPGSRTDQFRRLANAPLLASNAPALIES